MQHIIPGKITSTFWVIFRTDHNNVLLRIIHNIIFVWTFRNWFTIRFNRYTAQNPKYHMTSMVRAVRNIQLFTAGTICQLAKISLFAFRISRSEHYNSEHWFFGVR